MKKWAIWKTIVSVIAGLVFICGVTLGGVYLGGGFDDDETYPKAITFVIDDELNKIYRNGQIEATQDFYLTLTTDTKNVTATEVDLSLNNGSYTVDNVNGTVTDGVITVPQVVEI